MQYNFRQIFNPTKEEKIQQLKRYKEIAQSIPKGSCAKCKHLIGPDPYLPGWVTDYGECAKSMSCFAKKVCHLEESPCPAYEESTSFEDRMDELIKEAENATN